MRVSVLGCGWLGLALSAELVRRGHAVKGSVTSAEKLVELAAVGVEGHWLELTPALEGDIDNFFDADALVITLPPRRSEAGVGERYPAQIRAALRHVSPTTHVVFTSSTSVYPNLNRVVTEQDAGGELSGSGQAVLEAENLLREQGAAVLRLAGLYGYDRQPGRRLAGRDISGGDAPVNLVHRDDVVRVCVRVLEHGLRNITLNVCADRHPTRREVYTRQAERYGFSPPRFVEPHAQGFKLVSSGALKRTLSFTFNHPDPLADAP